MVFLAVPRVLVDNAVVLVVFPRVAIGLNIFVCCSKGHVGCDVVAVVVKGVVTAAVKDRFVTSGMVILVVVEVNGWGTWTVVLVVVTLFQVTEVGTDTNFFN